MYVKQISLTDYKSFDSQQEIDFSEGFNLIVGSNNSGKTSALDCFSLDIRFNDPHRSILRIPVEGDSSRTSSELSIKIATTLSEIFETNGKSSLLIPVQVSLHKTSEIATRDSVVNKLRSDCSTNPIIELERIQKDGLNGYKITAFGKTPEAYFRFNTSTVAAAAIPDASLDGTSLTHIQETDLVQHFEVTLNHFASSIFRFNSERQPSAVSPLAASPPKLDPNCNALPFCLNYLQTHDSYRHRILVNWVQRVFPNVKWVGAVPTNGQFEIRCYPNAPEVQRPDLYYSLSKMGSGIGNVIAILYIVVTSQKPRVIVIDEPNTFLHPKALRELLSILEIEGKEHQYIMTTHSADVLASVKTKSLTVLNFDGTLTTVKKYNETNINHARSELIDIGIRLTDLQSKDRVLWVEGQTEELVMPEILRWACPEIAAGTAVLRVAQTGTFNTKRLKASAVAEIYESLARSSALVPPLVGILLDREHRKTSEVKEISRQSNGKLHFLERTMLENYLLNSEAVCFAIASEFSSLKFENVKREIKSELETISVQNFDAAKFLKKLFDAHTESRVEFKKTKHVPMIVSWLLENDPAFLDPLRIELMRICKPIP